jgi:uncharacterized protein DUF6131
VPTAEVPRGCREASGDDLIATRESGHPHSAGTTPPRRLPGHSKSAVQNKVGICMIALGIILLIIGFIAKVAILWTIGIVLVLVGLALMVLGMMGRAVGGRRHYY